MIDEIVNAGNDMARAVSDAVASGDFSHLNEDLQNSARKMTDSVKAEGENFANRVRYGFSSTPYVDLNGADVRVGQQGAGSQTPSSANTQNTAAVRPGRTGRRMRSNYLGEGKNIALTIVGFMGLAFNVPFFFWGLTDVLRYFPYFESLDLRKTIFFAICSGLFGWMTGANLSSIRARNFARLIDSAAGDADYIELKDLAARLAMPLSKVQKSAMKVLQKGFLPDAHIDAQGTTLMLSDRSYKQYTEAEHSRVQRETAELEKEQAASAKARADAARAKESTGNKDVDRILSEGSDYIRTIREINDKIPDAGDSKAMSDKLYTLEDIVRRIMDQVRKDPSSADNIQMLMDYYLPTTVKLLNAYVGVMNQPAGENIENTKREIEASMDTINAACLKVLDSMFADVAWDVSSDINVMKQMMARDGLQ